VTPADHAPAANPGRVIGLSLLAWGFGYLALGRRTVALAWLIAEIVAAALVAYLFIGLADTTWYLLPFVAGVLFLVVWGAQAVLAYRAAGALLAAAGEPVPRSAAASMAWLTIPLLVWGTGFWLATGSATSAAATLDHFESSWPSLASGGKLDPELDTHAVVSASAARALATLQRLCAAGDLSGDCSGSARNLVRDVRISLTTSGTSAATATVTVVSFERRPSQFLGIFAASELVPVPRQTLLTLHLRAQPAPFPGGLQLGAERWQILDAAAP
jgi:hypothetical protein